MSTTCETTGLRPEEYNPSFVYTPEVLEGLGGICKEGIFQSQDNPEDAETFQCWSLPKGFAPGFRNFAFPVNGIDSEGADCRFVVVSQALSPSLQELYAGYFYAFDDVLECAPDHENPWLAAEEVIYRQAAASQEEGLLAEYVKTRKNYYMQMVFHSVSLVDQYPELNTPSTAAEMTEILLKMQLARAHLTILAGGS